LALQLGGDGEELAASCTPLVNFSGNLNVQEIGRGLFLWNHLICSSSQGDGNNFAIFWGPKAI
jgi:hypothetical protein